MSDKRVKPPRAVITSILSFGSILHADWICLSDANPPARRDRKRERDRDNNPIYRKYPQRSRPGRQTNKKRHQVSTEKERDGASIFSRNYVHASLRPSRLVAGEISRILRTHTESWVGANFSVTSFITWCNYGAELFHPAFVSCERARIENMSFPFAAAGH